MAWILMGFALIAVIDMRPLIRQRKGRAIAAFLTLFTVALTLEVLQALNIEVPSVMLALRYILWGLGLSYKP
jgi:hypothetical protein